MPPRGHAKVGGADDQVAQARARRNLNLELLLAGVDLLGDEFLIAGQTGLALGAATGRVGVNPLELLLDHLAAALGLLGLGGHHGLLLLQPLLVVPLIRIGAPGVHLQDPLGDVVEEVTVVRHHDKRALELLEEGLNPGYRLRVQVIGRLVEQEHVRIGDEQTAHRHAALLAAGKLPRQRVRIRAAQGLHCQLHLVLQVPQVVGVDDFLQSRHLLLRAGLVQTAAEVLILLEHGLGAGHALHDALLHGLLRIELRLLRQIAHLHALGHLARAHVVLVQPRQNLEERGLARAVRANHADVRPMEKGQVHVIQDDLLLMVLGDVL